MISLSFEEKKEIGYQYVRDMLEPVSPYGVKRLRNEGFYGSGQSDELNCELDNIASLVKILTNDLKTAMDIRQRLSGLKELSGTFSRCSEGFVLTEVEFFELNSFCRRINDLLILSQSLKSIGYPECLSFSSMAEPMKLLNPQGNSDSGFYIEDLRTSALYGARARKRSIEKQLRIKTDEALYRQRQEAIADEEKALDEIYDELSTSLIPYMPLFVKNAETAGRLDASLAKALLAKRFGCIRPQIGGEEISLTDSLHPQYAAALETRNRTFSPISITMPKGVTVLTGANMGGKSAALKTVVLNAALALSGCFLFCKEAKIPLFDRIDIINRDLSDPESGLSSFGAEILRFRRAVDQIPAEGLSLIAIDEFAKGTNAGEGDKIVQAAVKYLNGKNAVSLLTTHYDSAAEFSRKHYQVKGLRMFDKKQSVEKRTIENETDALNRIENAMDYGLIEVSPGMACPQDAVRICRMLGIPQEMLDEI